MKNKKINLKTLENVLSEKELKSVVGGYNPSLSDCGKFCNKSEDCPEACPVCLKDEGGHTFRCV